MQQPSLRIEEPETRREPPTEIRTIFKKFTERETSNREQKMYTKTAKYLPFIHQVSLKQHPEKELLPQPYLIAFNDENN